MSIKNFSDVFEFLSTNSFSRDEMNYSNGTYKNIHYGDILIKFSTYKNVLDADVPFLNTSVSISHSMSLLKTGDIIMADTAEDYTAGKSLEISNNSSIKVLSGLHTIALRPKIKFYKGYLGYYFNSYSYRKQLMKLIQGTKVYSISKSSLLNTQISVPSLEYQCQVSELLTRIDSRIETQNKIIEDYKIYIDLIKEMLIFNNKNINKIITIGKIGKLKTGYAFKSNDYEDNGMFNVITISNVTGSRYIDSSNTNKISNVPNDIQPHQMLKEEDILISLTGNVGRVSKVIGKNNLLNQRVGVLSLNSVDKSFVYHCLSTKRFENEMISKGQGAAQKNIGNRDVESFSFPYSDNNLHISLVSKLLDKMLDKLNIEEEILYLINLEKQYMLKNLFI